MRLPYMDDVCCYQGWVNHGSTELHLSSPPTPDLCFICCLWNMFCLYNSAVVEEFIVYPAVEKAGILGTV